MRGFRHRVGALVALLTMLVVAPSAAAATDCPATSDLGRPFLPFADPAQYYLAPGGDFEGGLWPGGRPVDGNEPFQITPGHRSLEIAAGSAATSPTLCIGLGDPTIRFFASRTGGPAIGMLGVDAVFTDITGAERRVPLVPVVSLLSDSWVLTLPTPILANVIALPGPTADVHFVFTPTAGSTWRIDDVYVDPYARN